MFNGLTSARPMEQPMRPPHIPGFTLTEVAPCATVGCENTATHNHRHCRKCYQTWKQQQAQHEEVVVTSPTGQCGNAGCLNPTVNHHKYCGDCYKSWRMTRGQCKWRHQDGSLCDQPVAGNMPFCQTCYHTRYLPCLAETTAAAKSMSEAMTTEVLRENVAPSCSKMLHANGYQKVERHSPLPPVDRAAMVPNLYHYLAHNIPPRTYAVGTRGASHPVPRAVFDVNVTSAKVRGRNVIPSNELQPNAPLFTPATMLTNMEEVSYTGGCAVPCHSPEDKTPGFASRLRRRPLPARPLFPSLDMKRVSSVAEATEDTHLQLLSPGTRADCVVEGTWSRVNAQAATAVHAMHVPAAMPSAPKKDKEGKRNRKHSALRTAHGPTWDFSVYPGDLEDGFNAVPDPFAEKMERLLGRGRGKWIKGAPPASPLVSQLA